MHAGADAKVFLAYHRQTFEQVAVKIISECFTKMVPADSIHTDLCTAKVAGVSRNFVCIRSVIYARLSEKLLYSTHMQCCITCQLYTRNSVHIRVTSANKSELRGLDLLSMSLCERN